MNRLLARLERSFLGRLAIPHLISYVVGGSALVFVLFMLDQSFLFRLTLDRDAVLAGEVWRLFTFQFIPGSFSPIWVLFALYVTYLVGSQLEARLGTFAFNVYYALAVLGSLVGAWFVGEAGSGWIYLALFLAFATEFPDVEFRIFFILPVKVKWLGMLSLAGALFAAYTGGWPARIALVAALAPYPLFYAGYWRDAVRGRNVRVRQAARRVEMSADPTALRTDRQCAICGARQDDGADIRVCTCEKCGGPRNLCLEHARNH